MLKAVLTGVATVGLFALAPVFYANQTLLFSAMMYLVLAQGINVLYGFTGYLPFGYVGFFGAGAYAGALSVLRLGLSPVLALVVGGVVAVLVGVVLVPLLRLSGAYFAIANLAAAQALYYVVSNPDLQALTNGPYGINLAVAYNATASYAAMVALLGLALATVVYLRHSRLGLALRAIREDRISAELAGINVVRERTIAWLLSALLAGLCGAAFAWYISVFYPETVFSLNVSIFAIVFALFGGAATLAGPIVGTLVLYGLYSAIGISQPEYFQLIFGLVIVGLVLFLPDGLASLSERAGFEVP
ncbi:MAG: branched-chain amino acid ABC transporter permease [Deltaproteobacteria bacterium]|nr:branched-chain amino acid ABC transporter permease [Deltaproteobacteria bacterium]